MKEKQFLAIASIAVIFFLFGTMFKMNFMALGDKDKETPWDKVWTTISDLQDRVNTIEEETNQVKTIRFYEPNETIIPPPSTNFKDGAVFVWTPNNGTNNAILSIRSYFQYRSEPSSGGLRYKILINDETVMRFAWLFSAEYKWTPIFMDSDSFENPSVHPLYPNQNTYTIKVQFACETTGYVKDINILIEVADGLPASN